jgi:hypothetical protein
MLGGYHPASEVPIRTLLVPNKIPPDPVVELQLDEGWEGPRDASVVRELVAGYPESAITWVIRWTWAEAMEAHSALSVDLLEEAVE